MKIKWWKKNKKEASTDIQQDSLVMASLETTGRKKKEKKTLTPAQKKKRRKRIFMGVAAVCVALFIASRVFAPEVLPVVAVRRTETGTIEQTVDTSGTVKTEKQKTYFSPLSAVISECKVEKGDAVSAGDVLLVYDAEDLKNRESEARLQNDEAYYTYQDTVGKSNSDAAEYSRSSQDTMLTANGRKQVEATKELAALKAEKVKAAVAEVSEGLKAEFGGIVTDVKAVNGSAVEESGELLTIESNEDVCVEISLSKSELEKVKEGQKAIITIVGKEYEGTVTRISKSAAKNDKGAVVVAGEIHINNPDADIFLGVEAKVKIESHKAENVVMVPIESVNIGKEGSFVYVVKDGIVEIRNVETGISSAEFMEIKSGLEENEQVVLNSGAGITEGAQVTPMEG